MAWPGMAGMAGLGGSAAADPAAAPAAAAEAAWEAGLPPGMSAPEPAMAAPMMMAGDVGAMLSMQPQADMAAAWGQHGMPDAAAMAMQQQQMGQMMMMMQQQQMMFMMAAAQQQQQQQHDGAQGTVPQQPGVTDPTLGWGAQ
eukprot:5263093-Prymnesium_polylepis.1